MAPAPDPWQDYRRHRRVLRGATRGGLGCLAVGFAFARSRHSATPLYVGLGMFAGLVAWGTGPLSEFPCPHCGEPFGHRGRSRNLFTRRCLHCQHPRGG